MNRLSVAAFWLGLIPAILAASAARAQFTETDRSRLEAEIERARQSIDPDRLPDLAAARAALGARIDEMERYLSTNASPRNRDAWLQYLKLEPLREAAAEERFTPAAGREAIALRHRLIGTSPGLELPPFRRLRTAVEAFISAARFGNPERAPKVIDAQLELLAKRISELDRYPSSQEVATLGAIAGLINGSGQADQVVGSLQQTFARPNLAVLIGEPLVQQALQQDVQQTNPVRDCILGTRIVGTSHLSGSVSANLLPSVGAVRLEVSMAGRIVSNNTGYNGPVRLCTVGYGNVLASRIMSFSESGIRMEPARIRGTLRTEIRSVIHRLRLVRRIASKRAAQEKPAVDRIAEARMRQRVLDGFVEQTERPNRLSSVDAMAQVRPILQRLALSEPTRLLGSTDREIFLDLMMRGPDQVAAVSSRPAVPGFYLAAVQVHESLVTNAFTPLLSGRTFTNRQLNQLFKDGGLTLPNRIAADAEDDAASFEIDFARVQPIIFEARDQAIRIGVRGSRFAQGRSSIKRELEITATYRPARTAEGRLLLIRDGAVAVDFPGKKRLTLGQSALRAAIEERFANLFPETLLDRTFEVPGDVSLEAFRGRVFRPSQVLAEDGWLTVAAH